MNFKHSIALAALLTACGASYAPQWQVNVYRIDACLRAADARIEAVKPHQFVAVAKGQSWRARGHAVAAAWTAPDGRHFTLLHEVNLRREVESRVDGMEFLASVLVHEYAHHLVGDPKHGKRFESMRLSLARNTAHCG